MFRNNVVILHLQKTRIANLYSISILFLARGLLLAMYTRSRSIYDRGSDFQNSGNRLPRVANLPDFTYLSKYLHFLRGTHIHFQLAVGIRILCAKLASVDVRLYRCALHANLILCAVSVRTVTRDYIGS